MEDVESLSFGELIRTFRRRAKLSQEAFAHCLEKSRRSILDWEQGTSRPQTKGDLLEIARVARLSEEETVLLLRARGQDPSPRYWTVNYERNLYFTGRNALLTRLSFELRVARPLVVPQPLALTGLGGIVRHEVV